MPEQMWNEPTEGSVEEPRPEPDNPDRPRRGPAWARATIGSESPAQEVFQRSADASTGSSEGEGGL